MNSAIFVFPRSLERAFKYVTERVVSATNARSILTNVRTLKQVQELCAGGRRHFKQFALNSHAPQRSRAVELLSFDTHGFTTLSTLKCQLCKPQLKLIAAASRQRPVANSCKVGDVKIVIGGVSQFDYIERK